MAPPGSVPRTIFAIRMRFPPLHLLAGIFLALLLTACPSDDDGGSDGGLASGHYLILKDSDDFYAYEQYFVVRPGSRWEFIEYGARFASPSVVCQITRTRGSYNLQDSGITVTLAEGGESVEKCPITQGDFDGYTWEAVPAGSSQAFLIRNVTDTSFEGRDMFVGAPGWRTYRKGSDPHGYFD